MSSVKSASQEVGEATSPTPRFRVVVIAERCKECGLCVHVCPKHVLEIGSQANARGFRYPVPVRQEDCVGCRMCEYNCPDFAIFVVPAGRGD